MMNTLAELFKTCMGVYWYLFVSYCADLWPTREDFVNRVSYEVVYWTLQNNYSIKTVLTKQF